MDMATDMVAPNRPRLASRLLLGGALGLACQPGFALEEQTAGSRNWVIVPTLSSSLTWTDNAGLTGGQRQGDLYLSVDPGLSLSGQSGGAQARLSLRLHNAIYEQKKDLNRTGLYGNGTGSFDLYERRVMLDASFSSTRERLSLFGTPAANGGDAASGQTDYRTYQLSPYWRFQGVDTHGELRYRANYSNAGSSATSYRNPLIHTASLSYGSNTTQPLGWTLTGQYSLTDYSDARDVRSGSAQGSLFQAIDPLFIVHLDGGYEQNNYQGSASQGNATYGGGFTWTPSPRTRLAASLDKRFFGTGYRYELAWHGPSSALSATLSRDVSTSSQTLGVNELLSLYLAQVAALAGQIPDLAQRVARVDRDWVAHGLPALGQGSSYLSSSYYVERRAQITGSLNGKRSGLNLTSYYAQRDRLPDAALIAGGDDLANYQQTHEWGASFYANYSLSPRTSLNLSGSLSRSTGDGGASPASTRRRSFVAGANSTLGPHTTGGLQYRYTSSSGVTDYRENAVVANLGLTF